MNKALEKILNKNKKIQNRLAVSQNNELLLYGDIGDFWDYQAVTLDNVVETLRGFKDDSITVRINSNGGDVFEGIAIKNYLKANFKNITVKIDGIAASAASVIAMAGDEIIMAKDAQMMIHNAWTVAAGDAKQLRKVADDLDKVMLSVTQGYLDKFNGSLEELVDLLNNETFLTASESISLGLATKLEKSVDEEEKDEKQEEKDEEIVEKPQETEKTEENGEEIAETDDTTKENEEKAEENVDENVEDEEKEKDKKTNQANPVKNLLGLFNF